jgi:hypothetical protein
MEMRDDYEDLVESIITEGVEQGIFHVSDIKLATFALLGALNWIPHWYSPEGPLSPETIAEHYANILIGGLKQPEQVPGSGPGALLQGRE